MKNQTLITALVVSALFATFIPDALAATVCGPGQIQQCTCPDNTTGIQSCMDDGSGWHPCGCLWHGIWYDEKTDLSWQDPQKDAYSEDNTGVTAGDAVRYCEELTFGGYDDWRLPTLDELRTIIRGAPLSRSGGLCPAAQGSSVGGTTMLDIILCYGRLKPLTGPGTWGCCWDKSLTGTCSTIDPASTTHFLEYWSSTPAADDPEHWIGFVFFDTGTVGFNHALSLGEVRCVRDGPSPAVECGDGAPQDCQPGETTPCTCANGKPGAQVCAAGGDCWGPCRCTGFTPSPPPENICDQCDEITVTVRVPEKLDRRPYMLAAFLYKAGEIDMRPPDVGVNENEIRYPDIDLGKPVTTVIPGCSYYGDRCMSGQYYLSVYLKMNEGRFPAMPEPGDMAYRGEKVITLPGDGTGEFTFDVTVSPVFMPR